MKQLNYVISECDCQREQIAVVDEWDEDCNLWDRYNEIRNENEVCPQCGKLPAVNVSYAVPPANTVCTPTDCGLPASDSLPTPAAISG